MAKKKKKKNRHSVPTAAYNDQLGENASEEFRPERYDNLEKDSPSEKD
ncbi:MAG: hypothetical protein ACOX6S_05405 [Clostridia bacterium]